MLGNPLKTFITKLTRKLPLRFVLTVPFVILVVAATSLVGFLSYRNAQEAVNTLADQLITQASDRVDQQLDNYLALPHQINQLNVDAIQRGLLDPKDLDAAGRYFFKQAQVFKNFTYIGYALPDRTSAGAGRWFKGQDIVMTYHPGGSLRDYTYLLDNQGKRTKLIYEADYDSVNNEGFRKTFKTGKPNWSPPESEEGFEGYLSMSANILFSDTKGKPQGVLWVDFLLRDISTFLEQIKISRTGKVFIVERDGMLIASSDRSATYRNLSKDKSERIKAIDSSSVEIKAVSQQLQARFVNLQTIQTPQKFDFQLNGDSIGGLTQRQFVTVTPWRDQYGLDWLIIVTIPESDFMGQINNNNRTTIALCIAALVVAIAIGIWTARWISRPILEMNMAAKAIADGELDQTIDINRTDELGELAQSFNRMANQLETSFNDLGKTNQDLDRRVQDRTASITEAEAELRGLFSAMTDLVIVMDSQGRYLKIPTQNSPLLYAPAENLIGNTVDEMLPPDNAKEVNQWIHQVLDSQQSLSVEYSLFLNGQETIFAANISPISTEAVIVVTRDISDLRLALRARTQAEESLLQKNAELTNTLAQLEVAQEELIQSEKMAALGQLIAGIAHEINTPLGVIQASIGNIRASLHQSLEELPPLMQNLSPEHLADFFTLLTWARQPKESLSSREERQLKRAFRKDLTAQGLANADIMAETLSKMGTAISLAPILSLLQAPDAPVILDTAYQLSAIQNNSQNIQLAVERASRIVYALKNYIHHGNSVAKVNASVPEGIDIVLTLYQNQIKRGVKVAKVYESVPSLLCYPDELIQVWSNLISNAIQAMNYEGHLEINIAQQDTNIVVRITDSGIGIPDDIQEKIFQPFFTTKPMGEGSGLGLDIVRKIVDRHHGKIEVSSQPGQTIFSVWLPILLDEKESF